MVHIIEIKRYEEGKQLVLAALGDFGKKKKLEFKFPRNEAANITERADPFVHALLFPMMECGGEFEFDTPVSRSVIDNVTRFCRIWNMWLPGRCKPITIHAPLVNDDYRPNNRKLITAFSGGLDAAYTAYKYKNGLDEHFKYDLDKSIMLLGADIPLAERESFVMAFRAAKMMTDDLGIVLIPVETNYREQFDIAWGYCFGSVIAATLEFYNKKYFYGASASDDTVDHFQTPWGTNPVTDAYLASDTFHFMVDGYEHSRTQRAEYIKNWSVGLEHLRVCWRNADKSKNCGICEKCVRTMLNFMAVGVSHLPSMPSGLTPGGGGGGVL